MSLDKIKELNQGWDGYNGKPIKKEILNIVQNLDTKDWKIIPVPNGNIQLQKGDDEIEIFEEYAILVRVLKIEDIKNYL